jgi:predicted transporter
MTIMEIFEYLTGKGGIMVLGLIVLVIFIFRKWKEKRYFKDIEKRIKKNDD